MAEPAVNLVIDHLVPLLSQEVTLLRGVHAEVASIKDELGSIRAFLKDADSRAEKECNGEDVKEWVRQVREVAFVIEDVVDEYMIHVARHRDQAVFKAFLLKIASCRKRLKISSQIQGLKASLQEIKARSERYKFNSSHQGSFSNRTRSFISHDPRVGSLFVKEDELVGIESQREELIGRLVEGSSRRTVISVVGMGGAGKTTLAKKVFDSRSVMLHFDCYAWFGVSQSYKKEDLLRSITKKLCDSRKKLFPKQLDTEKLDTEKLDTMDYTSLVTNLNGYLHQKRYLVVFDDVWEEDFWGVVEHALADNDRGSRIMITTRNEDVANFCKRSSLAHVHHAELLPPEKAWQLFCNKAFQFDFDGVCPKQLEDLSRDIVGRCEGLPLAIVAVGGLLATKEKTILEWRKLCDSLFSELVSNPHLKNINRILSLSYNNLPYSLKPCFLYFGMFPEDYTIKRKRLLRLWIAGGFVKGKQGMTLEEVADEYLTELIHRNLVLVDEYKIDGTPAILRVHDLVRDVILSKSEDLNLGCVTTKCSSFVGVARHLSIGEVDASNALRSGTSSQTRSVMVFVVADMPRTLVRSIVTKYNLLRSLDFEDAPIEEIPKEVGNLLQLRYLSLRNTEVQTLPKSIGKLHNLETLDLRDCPVRELPVEISRFPKLHQLMAYSANNAVKVGVNEYHGLKIRGSIKFLESLQALYSVEVNNFTDFIDDLARLQQLRAFGIRKLKREHGTSLSFALEMMANLQVLYVNSFDDQEVIDLQSVTSPPRLLRTMLLNGRLESLPNWIPMLHNLVKLHLYFSRLTDNPLEGLKDLPNLMSLEIFDGYTGAELNFREGEFQKLKQLQLQNLEGLNKLTIDEGALHLLEWLEMGACQRLIEVPSGIRHLKKLEVLTFLDVPKEYVQKILPGEGQDYSIVEHIPEVYVTFTSSGRSYKLGSPELDDCLQKS